MLIGVAIVLLTMGFNNLNAWGVFRATADAPFSIGTLSPALLFVVVGVICGQLFFMRTRSRMRQGLEPLVDLSVLANPTERSAVYAMFIIVAM